MEYPANNTDKPAAPSREKPQRVTVSEPKQRKKPLGKRFTETFLGGDARGVGSYVVLDVLIPAMRDMVTDVVIQGVERLVYPDGGRRRSSRVGTGIVGHTPYSRISSGVRPETRDISRRARATHNFDEILIDTRHEAEEVINGLFRQLEKYGQATVADLYDLAGITPAYTDNKFGWTDLSGTDIRRTGGAYLLILPAPVTL